MTRPARAVRFILRIQFGSGSGESCYKYKRELWKLSMLTLTCRDACCQVLNDASPLPVHHPCSLHSSVPSKLVPASIKSHSWKTTTCADKLSTEITPHLLIVSLISLTRSSLLNDGGSIKLVFNSAVWMFLHFEVG